MSLRIISLTFANIVAGIGAKCLRTAEGWQVRIVPSGVEVDSPSGGHFVVVGEPYVLEVEPPPPPPEPPVAEKGKRR